MNFFKRIYLYIKEETAYLKYTKQKKTVVCTFTLWVNEGFLISSKTFFFFLLQKPKAQTFKNQTFYKNDHHFCKKVNSAKSFVHSEREGTNYSFLLFRVFQISSSFFIMLTVRDVGKIVFRHDRYSDTSYKYFLLKKFPKDLMTCKNK